MTDTTLSSPPVQTGKLAWITGASSGIGRAVAIKLAREGYRVAASARSADKLMELQAEMPDRIFAFPLDVTDRAAASSVANAIRASLGPIDLAIFPPGATSATAFVVSTAEPLQKH